MEWLYANHCEIAYASLDTRIHIELTYLASLLFFKAVTSPMTTVYIARSLTVGCQNILDICMVIGSLSEVSYY
jgi:hypothetical protein